MLDPFIYTRQERTATDYAGDFYFNPDEVSEDILRDGTKFYESGMPVGTVVRIIPLPNGKIPVQA